MNSFAKKFLNSKNSVKKTPIQRKETFRGLLMCLLGLIFLGSCHIPYVGIIKHSGDVLLLLIYLVSGLLLWPIGQFVYDIYIERYRSKDNDINDRFKNILSIFGAFILAYLVYMPYHALAIDNYTSPSGYFNFGVVYILTVLYGGLYTRMLWHFYVEDINRRY